MQVKQIATLINQITGEELGKTLILNEDLSNVVDFGKTFLQNTDVDNFVGTLSDLIKIEIFNSRDYKGQLNKVIQYNDMYGAVRKIKGTMPEAFESETWKLENGTSYADAELAFYGSEVEQKIYTGIVTFDVRRSFADVQVLSAFDSRENLIVFMAMLENDVKKSLTVKSQALVRRTINRMFAETILDEYPDGNYNAKSTVKAVNLLYLYNAPLAESEKLTVDNCTRSADFLRFCSAVFDVYKNDMSAMSTIFNVEEKERFTDTSDLHVVFQSDFVSYFSKLGETVTFNSDLMKLPLAEVSSYWQGFGANTFADKTTIHITDTTSSINNLKISGIVGVMFDRDCLGVMLNNPRVRTKIVESAEFRTNFYKFDAHYFADRSENFVMFFIA